VLAHKSFINRVWMRTGKLVYNFVTRRLMNYHDTEGRGPRAMEQGPIIAKALSSAPGVRNVYLTDFPTAGHSFGLYVFVEATSPVSEETLRSHLAAYLADQLPPEHIQIVETLPRDASGAVRDDLLRLVALNQIDQITQLARTPDEQQALDTIIRGRLNLSDRVRRGI